MHVNVQALVTALPYIQATLKNKAILVVADKESKTIVSYLAGEQLDVGYKVGDQINPNDAILIDALKGKSADNIVGEEVYGIPFNAMAFPIKDGREIVGVYGVGIPMQEQAELEKYMRSMNEIISNLSERVHIIAAHSEELAATTEEINTQAMRAREDANRSNGITDIIRAISNQTNLLGLNASIEAARAGEHGKGFNIVAQEVRKLSAQTASATGNIETSLKSINLNLNSLRDNLDQINQASTEQASLVQDFSGIIADLDKLSSEIYQFVLKQMK